jgi:carbonic anhydrase
MKAEDALKKLKEGNARFAAGKMIHPNADAVRRDETVKNGQHPFVTILSCADSRVPDELVFDSGIGDLFIIRVAGNVANTDEIGSAEYGTEHLGTQLIVVLGHTSCGAVTAVARGDHLGGSIPELVGNIVPAVQRAKKEMGNDVTPKLIDKAIRENVFQSMSDLMARSGIIRDQMKEGKLVLIGAVYHLDSGSVEWIGEHPQQSVLLETVGPAQHKTAGYSYPLAIFIAMSVMFILFISGKRIVTAVHIQGRIAFAFLATIAGAVIAGVHSMATDITIKTDIIMFVMSLIFVVLFTVIYTTSIVRSFRNVIGNLKKLASS